MKKYIIPFTAAMLLCGMAFSSCTPASVPPTESSDDASDSGNRIPATDSVQDDVSSDGTADPTPIEAPKSLKVLAIGNSFSTDCMQYLYEMLKDGGVENVVLGNLYYGGCSLAQHLDFATNGKAEYKYYKNTSGSWEKTENYLLSDALKDEQWDYITFQQTSKTCGLQSSYGKTLTELVNYVEERAPEGAKFLWNMTWAYQQDSTHSSFPKYDNDQQKMYNMILDCVENCIKPETRFVGIIPCMTSVQNARTSFLGDTLTRDGYHMDYYIGRYVVGLTWFCALTGLEPDAVSFNPSSAMISDDMIAVAREAVAAAISNPYSVTQSKITEGKRGEGVQTDNPSIELDPADFFEADKRLAAGYNVDLSNYTLYKWEYSENQYWYCTKQTTKVTPKSTAGAYQQNVCTKVLHSTADIPVGSIIISDEGWQYRMEIFPNATTKYTGSRPGITTARFFVLTDEFLNGCTYMGWNVSSNPKSDISSIYAQAACHVRVYVPKNS